MSGSGDMDNGDELQQYINFETQQALFRSEIMREVMDLCWEKCVTGKPKAKLDGKTATCLEHCAVRFVDATRLINRRFAYVMKRQCQSTEFS